VAQVLAGEHLRHFDVDELGGRTVWGDGLPRTGVHGTTPVAAKLTLRPAR